VKCGLKEKHPLVDDCIRWSASAAEGAMDTSERFLDLSRRWPGAKYTASELPWPIHFLAYWTRPGARPAVPAHERGGISVKDTLMTFQGLNVLCCAPWGASDGQTFLAAAILSHHDLTDRLYSHSL